MSELEDAVDDLREFVNNHFDGSVSRILDLDELLWKVRLAHHHEPEMVHMERPKKDDFLETLDLEDLGL